MNEVPGGLHVETLLLVYQLVAALLSLVTLGGAWQARGRYGLWFWAASFVAIWLSQLARPWAVALWGEAAGFTVGHLGGIVASALLLLGVRAFLGEPQRRWPVALLATTAAVIAVAGTASGLPAWTSLSFTLIASTALRAQALPVLWRAWRYERGFAMALAVATFSLSVVAHLARAIAVIPAISGSVDSAYEANALWMMVFIALLIIQGLVVLLLVNGSLQREVLALAEYDPLTGLLNRRGLVNRFARMVQRAECEQQAPQVALAMIDIDHFKQINDRHGHCIGDDVLANLGRRLESHTRPADLAVRLGGEEFALVWVGANGQQAHALAERLRQAVEAEPIVTRAGQIATTISVGVADMQSLNEPLDALLLRVDRALYRAKEAGRNRVMFAA